MLMPLAQLVQLLERARGVAVEELLADLELQLRIEFGVGERRLHVVHEFRALELQRGDVDGNAYVVRPAHGVRASWPSTQRPMSSIAPERSAIGRKSSGIIRPLVGWHQRISASQPIACRVRKLSSG
jgi:hypothetical protein